MRSTTQRPIGCLLTSLIAVSIIAPSTWSYINAAPRTSTEETRPHTTDNTTASAQPAETQTEPSSSIGEIQKNTHINLSYYFDSRDYNTMNLLVNSTALPWGLNVFGFTDLHGTEGQSSNRFDMTRFFHEYRLRRPLSPDRLLGLKGFDIELEYNDANGPDNSLLRAGLGYQHSVPFLHQDKSWLQWRILPWRSDGKGWQLSNTHFFVLTERIKLIGFADYNIVNNAPNQWVAESELSFTLTDTFDLIVEGRFNGFEERNPSLDGVGVAGGIRVKL